MRQRLQLLRQSVKLLRQRVQLLRQSVAVWVGAASDLLGSDSVGSLEVKESRLELSRLDMREAAADHTPTPHQIGSCHIYFRQHLPLEWI